MAGVKRAGGKKSGSRWGVLPLYYSVYYVLRQELLAEAYSSGQALPSELDLAARFSVSRVTIRRALARLEDESLIRRVRGRNGGTFPVEGPRRFFAAASVSSIQHQFDWAEYPDSRLLSRSTCSLPREIWNLDSRGTAPRKVIRLSRLLIQEEKPIAFVREYIPLAYQRSLRSQEVVSSPRVFSSLASAGLFPATGIQQTSMAEADAFAARRLGVSRGSLLVKQQRLMRDQEGYLLEALDVRMRPEFFKQVFSMSPMVREAEGAIDRSWARKSSS